MGKLVSDAFGILHLLARNVQLTIAENQFFLPNPLIIVLRALVANPHRVSWENVQLLVVTELQLLNVSHPTPL